jgi:hypothetical protein
MPGRHALTVGIPITLIFAGTWHTGVMETSARAIRSNPRARFFWSSSAKHQGRSALNNITKPACLGMILTACCLAQPALSTEKASVSGSVSSVAGEPLRRVTLRLTPLPAARGSSMEAPAANVGADTDSQGNFTFDEVAPGHYMLEAERTGYLNARFGNALGSVLTINPGQKTTDIVIKMTPQGIVAGRVVDDEKESLPGVTVNVRLYSAHPRG